jgi:hypothetical protein
MARACAAVFGLVTASALLVHLSGGTIEVHFHFFVMVGLIEVQTTEISRLVSRLEGLARTDP